MVTLADEFAGSDGNIVTAAIRLLGLGPVVGTRTWGGVIGIDDPGHELVDGTQITVPGTRSGSSEYGWSVENYGVDPDVEVLNIPRRLGRGPRPPAGDGGAAARSRRWRSSLRGPARPVDRPGQGAPAAAAPQDPGGNPENRPASRVLGRRVMAPGYLRYPHVHGDLITFVAGDDVWLAPAGGGRAWRLSADDVPVSYPRFSPDGTQGRLDQLAGRQPRGVPGRHRGQRRDQAHLLG